MVSKFSEESFQSAWRAPGPVQSSLDGDGTEEAEGVNAAGVAEGSGCGGGGGTRSGSGGRAAVVQLRLD